MKQTRMSKNIAMVALVAFLAFPSYSGSLAAAQKKGKQKEASAVKVIELRKIEKLREAFQRDAGKIRFVTIISPT